ncbi:MAG: hypothetical protein ACM3TN_14100 [Alphaproteobacteria bacterium]
MNLAEYRQDYYDFSEKASSGARQLAFAGIGVIWVLRTAIIQEPKVPATFLPALGLLVIALASDFLHYVTATVIWGAFCRVHELHGRKDTDALDAPRWLNWPTEVLFWVKVMAVLGAYLLIGQYVWRAWL